MSGLDADELPDLLVLLELVSPLSPVLVVDSVVDDRLGLEFSRLIDDDIDDDDIDWYWDWDRDWDDDIDDDDIDWDRDWDDAIEEDDLYIRDWDDLDCVSYDADAVVEDDDELLIDDGDLDSVDSEVSPRANGAILDE